MNRQEQLEKMHIHLMQYLTSHEFLYKRQYYDMLTNFKHRPEELDSLDYYELMRSKLQLEIYTEMRSDLAWIADLRRKK